MLCAPVGAEAASCGPTGLQELLTTLESKHQEKPTGLGTTGDGAVVFLTMTADRSGWTIVAALPNGGTCVITAGHNWESIKPVAEPNT